MQAGLERRLLAVTISVLLILSAIDPAGGRLTWLLETTPVTIALVVLAATYRFFPLTPLAYRLLGILALIMIVGGYYSFAQVPVFNWLRDTFDLSRNHYDRLAHFIQGFAPAIVIREVLVRLSPLRSGPWLYWIVIALCLALSASYELVEWLAAVTLGAHAEAFLATQGDRWDTQWDLLLATLGAISALLVLQKLHDRQLARLALPRGRG